MTASGSLDSFIGEGHDKETKLEPSTASDDFADDVRAQGELSPPSAESTASAGSPSQDADWYPEPLGSWQFKEDGRAGGKRAAAREAIGAAGSVAMGAIGGLFRREKEASRHSVDVVPVAVAAAAQAAAAAPPAYPEPNPSLADVPCEDLLCGEKVYALLKNCYLMLSSPFPACELSGDLVLTNFRLKFRPTKKLRQDLRWMTAVAYFDVPMGAICSVEEDKEKVSGSGGAVEYRLKVIAKDHRVLTISPWGHEERRTVHELCASFGIVHLFARRHAEAVLAAQAVSAQAGTTDLGMGWDLLDAATEYLRMGAQAEDDPCPASPWVVSSINEEYGLCSTYPSLLTVPRGMNAQELRAVAGFRKRGRLPVMSWCGGPQLDFASLWRCSQTTEGMMGHKCPEDQKLVGCIRRGAKSEREVRRDLLVVDLRPWKAAWANKAGGGGFEGYPKCKLVFGGIDNIHAVRKAWKDMDAAVCNAVDGEVGTWMKDVALSSWYDYIGAILNSTVKVVREISEEKSSVMVHCSDGWDRTAQVCSLSMLCLDSRWRTQEGFLRLIQKEWCSFGHRFKTRLANGEAPTDEYSPIFIQWLECVYQLTVQFPTQFEFCPSVLLRLANEVFTNQYGTFLYDNERERNQKVAKQTVSLWAVLLQPEALETWRNSRYDSSSPSAALVPAVCQANYVVWDDFWWRWHPRGHKKKISTDASASQATL